MYLLDTNILIYLLRGDIRLGKFLANLNQEKFGISMISRMEVLIGADKESFTYEELCGYLDVFQNMNVDKRTVEEAVMINKKLTKSIKFKDMLIAASSIVSKATLITSDKDFEKVKGLKIKYYKFQPRER